MDENVTKKCFKEQNDTYEIKKNNVIFFKNQKILPSSHKTPFLKIISQNKSRVIALFAKEENGMVKTTDTSYCVKQ